MYSFNMLMGAPPQLAAKYELGFHPPLEANLDILPALKGLSFDLAFEF